MNSGKLMVVSAMLALGATFLGGCCASCQSGNEKTTASASSEQKPNIVIFMTDDQGYGDLSFTGNPILKTPNIDNFAKTATRMTNFHVSPTCAPTRAGLMSGKYCNSVGVWRTISQRASMDLDISTLPEAFKANSYATGMFGKWHLGDSFEYRPENRGFDIAMCCETGGVQQISDYWGNNYFDDTYYVNGKPTKFDGYCTDVWVNKAIEFMKKNVAEKKPFLCYIPTNAAHGPFNVAEKYSSPYAKQGVGKDRANFYGMIANIDENFQRLLDEIDKLGIADNTIVIFMTDNGTSAGCSTNWNTGVVKNGYNAGMRGQKCSVYEGGHRVPFYIRYPNGKLVKGEDFNTVVANFDLLPTLLDMANLEFTPKKPFDGKSFKTVLEGKKSKELEDRILFVDSQFFSDKPELDNPYSAMKGEWRLVNGKELYNLKEDLAQTNDLSKKYPEKVKELKDAHDKWFKSTCSGDYSIHNPDFLNNKRELVLDAMYLNGENHKLYMQSHLIEGGEAVGFWEVMVEDAGEYEFDIRRFPKASDMEIVPTELKNVRFDAKLRVIPYKYAALYIDGKEIAKSEIKSGDKGVKIKTSLTKGRHIVEAKLIGDTESNCAYFVYINAVK